MRKVIQTSQQQISGNGEEKSMSLQEVFLVNPFLLPAKEREQTITATSGLICSGPYMRSDPIGLSVKMLLVSSRWYSPVRRLRWEVNPLYSERVTLYLKDDSNMLLKPFAVILSMKDIPSNRYLYRLVPSVRPIEETGCGLLPTGTASDFKRRGPNSKQQGLPEKIFEMLPTPQAADSSIGAVIGRNDRFILTKNGVPRKINQNGQNGSVGLGRIFRLMCTPTATDWKGGSTRRQRAFQRSSLRSEVHADFGSGRTSQLNPLFVEEMMGFPTGWISRPFLKEVAIQAEAQPLIDGEQNP